MPQLPEVPTAAEAGVTGYYSTSWAGLVVPKGTPIYASAGGVVAYAALHPQYGNLVEIDHGNGVITRYAHNSKLLVQVGQVVRRGQKISLSGATGRATGPHMHFEVRYKGVAQNPVRFLKDAEAKAMAS